MEQQGFEFSGVLRVLIVVAFALVIGLFKTGGKGAPTEPVGDSDDDEESYDPFKRFMEMFEGPAQESRHEHDDEELHERAEAAERELRRKTHSHATSIREVKPTAQATTNRAAQNTFKMEPIAENDEVHQSSVASEIAENFDLRQAVIMSEILAPKFKEN